MSGIDPVEFGEVKATAIATASLLNTHVTECSESNKQVAKNLDRLIIAVGLLALVVVGDKGLPYLLKLIVP